MQMDFWQFSRNAYICIIPGKLSESHMHAWLFSNPCGQVLESIKSRGQICPIIERRKRTFSHGSENNHACKWILCNFPGIIHMPAFLENCQKSMCMHGCSPIHMEMSYSLLEFHGLRIWECNVKIKSHLVNKHLRFVTPGIYFCHSRKPENFPKT